MTNIFSHDQAIIIARLASHVRHRDVPAVESMVQAWIIVHS